MIHKSIGTRPKGSMKYVGGLSTLFSFSKVLQRNPHNVYVSTRNMQYLHQPDKSPITDYSQSIGYVTNLANGQLVPLLNPVTYLPSHEQLVVNFGSLVVAANTPIHYFVDSGEGVSHQQSVSEEELSLDLQVPLQQGTQVLYLFGKYSIREIEQIKNTILINGNTVLPEFSPKHLFLNGEQGVWLDPTININESWRTNFVESTDNPNLWVNGFSHVTTGEEYTLTLTEDKPSGIGLGAASTYPVGTALKADTTVYRSVEVKKVDARYLRFGAAADPSAVFIDLDSLEVLRNSSAMPVEVKSLYDGFIRISTFKYHDVSPGAAHASNLLGWGNTLLIASLADTSGTSLIVRKPVFSVLEGEQYIAPSYQKIPTVSDAFIEANPNHKLFQDVLLQQPVTEAGQTVSIGLDSAFPLEYSENVWDFTQLNVAGESTYDAVAQTINVKTTDGSVSQVSCGTGVAGALYEVSFEILSITGRLAFDFLGANSVSTVGKHTFKAIASSAALTFKRSGIMDAVIGNISVRRIGQLNAYQLNSASKPIYRDGYIEFDGIDDFLQLPVFVLPSPLTVMVAFESIKKSGTQALFSGGQSGYLLISGGSNVSVQQNSGNPTIYQPKEDKEVATLTIDNGKVTIKTSLGEVSSTELSANNPYSALSAKFIGNFNASTATTAAGIKLFGLVVINRVLSADEEHLTREYLYRKAGIV